MSALGRPGLAAITLHERGGGIAAVSRLVRDVLDEAAGHSCPTWTLSPSTTDGRFHSGIVERARFGVEVALTQLMGRCDWLFYTHLSLASVQAFVPRSLRRPYVVFLHDVEAWSPLTPFRHRVLAGATVRVANSQYTADRVIAANPGVGAIVPCHLALPAGWIFRSGDSGSMAPAPTVLTVGRMVGSERYKGHDQLLEAWPAVLASVPSARLVFAGEGNDVPRLREKAVALGVAAAVAFPGFLPAVGLRRLYAEADVFAMPSRREGFGLVYLEAMAAAVPCIASNDDAAREIVEDGATGFLVAQADTATLAARIVTLLRDPALRVRMGQAGRVRYERHFTSGAFKERLLAILGAIGTQGVAEPHALGLGRAGS